MKKVEHINVVGLFSFSEKLRGLLSTQPDAYTYALFNCNSVHTIGMKHALDIAFIDEDGEVLQVYNHIPAGFKMKCKKATVTLERFSSMHKSESWLKKGQIVKLVTNNNKVTEEKEMYYEEMSSM